MSSDGQELGNEDAADLAAELRLVVGRLNRRLRQLDHGGLTPSQLSALMSIHALEPVRLVDLAAAEGITAPTLTKIVANLEDAGMVARKTDAVDKRSARLTVTAEGHGTIKRIRAERNAYLRRRLDAMGAGKRQVLLAALPLLAELVGDDG